MIKNIFGSGNLPAILPKGYLKERYENICKKGLPEGIKTGVECLDKLIRLFFGTFTVITGRANDGKSTFVDFLCSMYNRGYGLKTLFVSFENNPVERHVSKLVSKFTNKSFNELDADERNRAFEYITNNFHFFNYEEYKDIESIISNTEQAVNELGIKVVVIDPFNCLESGNGESLYDLDYIRKTLNSLRSFAKRCNIILILVAHPKKMNDGKTPDGYDIMASSDFMNKSDFIIAVNRDRVRDNVRINMCKVRDDNFGTQGECYLKYHVPSGNFYEFDEFDFDDEKPEKLVPPFVFPTTESKKDSLDVEVSLYSGATDNTGTTVNLKEFLFSDAYKGVVETIRSGETPEERHRIKDEQKGRIPAVTISGLFSQRGSKNIVSPSGLISVDIDLKDNKDIMSCIPDILRKLEYVAYFGKSISGDGYFAVIPIENPNHFKEHFFALEQEMKSYGITIDKSCKDIGRLRFASYDADGYYNPNATTYYWEVDTTQPPKVSKPTYTATSTMSDAEKVEQQISMLKQEGLSIPDDYDTWFRVGMSLSSTFGEEGRKYFHELSSTSQKYDKYECDRQYDEIVSHYENDNQYTLGTLYHIIKEARDGSSMA